jgi:branched-chain amino acid transport system ATP-binding protein
MLRLQNLRTYFGKLLILKGISVHLQEGELVTLIGGNGSGKSTLLNTVAGLLHPKRGKILFDGHDITHAAPERIVNLGIALVPEGRQLFAPLTVKDNLVLGAYHRYGKRTKGEIHRDIEEVYELFPILRERSSQLAGTLSGGEQQMLAIGRALMSKPKLLLLDEPSMGLAPLVMHEIFRTIRRLHEQRTTILLVEQNARMALEVADRGYVMETGKIVYQGPKKDLLENQEIKRAYLGGRENSNAHLGPRI